MDRIGILFLIIGRPPYSPNDVRLSSRQIQMDRGLKGSRRENRSLQKRKTVQGEVAAPVEPLYCEELMD